MKILNASSPKTLRDDVLKYLLWRIKCEAIDGDKAKTRAVKRSHEARAAVLEDVRQELESAVLTPF